MNKKTVGRPRKGNEIRERNSIRLEKTVKDSIVANYGSLQTYIDYCLMQDGFILAESPKDYSDRFTKRSK